ALIKRMQREARIAAQLQSRFVQRIYDFDRTGRSPVLVMELLEGHTLHMEMSQRGSLPVHEAASYVVQACAGVANAHVLGIVHRAVKPANLILEANTGSVRVVDFGISKVLGDDDEINDPFETVGALAYLSPEQLRTGPIDARVDVWALGVVLYR